MADRPRIGLDNSVFAGRLRQPRAPTRMVRHRPVIARPDVAGPLQPVHEVRIEKPQPFSEPAIPRQQPSQVLRRQVQSQEQATADKVSLLQRLLGVRQRYSKAQLVLVGMAGFVFVIGLAVSLQTMLTNHDATAKVAALSKQQDQGDDGDNPSTEKPSAQAFSGYAVAPDLARYIKIPKLGVNARVMQVGVKASGELRAPSNVYDAAWYTGSAKPGQPGATLIDGHVSSWTTRGAFYGLKKLTAGDNIQIVRGDGSILNYRVVKSQIYDAENVDMQAAVTPVTQGKSGLNLISCTGQVKKGTNDFDQRVIVFAEQI